MDFELIDGYLLDGAPRKDELVRKLVANRPESGAAAPFYEGVARLGARTPDLALIALRLVLGGAKANDANVAAARDLIARVKSGDEPARDEYRALVRPPA
ncbi:MAG TPA: hypothetical protein VHX17_04800 [Candidatus Cybelea sp.]|jgi:hypothetical protein|nr:hypothetical protein [Candidatus Cybelea sp.]